MQPWWNMLLYGISVLKPHYHLNTHISLTKAIASIRSYIHMFTFCHTYATFHILNVCSFFTNGNVILLLRCNLVDMKERKKGKKIDNEIFLQNRKITKQQQKGQECTYKMYEWLRIEWGFFLKSHIHSNL